MALTGKTFTTLEKAALCYKVLTGCDDWRDLYAIATGTDRETADNTKYIDVYVSKWKNSEKVAAYLDTLQKQLADRDAEQRQEGAINERRKAEESERAQDEGTAKFAGPIDYSDPANRKRLYNSVIARSKDDPRTQLDAAKLFEQIQKDDREAARTQKVVRSYLPIRCNSCPLYQKEKEKTTK